MAAKATPRIVLVKGLTSSSLELREVLNAKRMVPLSV